MKLLTRFDEVEVGDYLLNYDRLFVKGLILILKVTEILEFAEVFNADCLREITKNHDEWIDVETSAQWGGELNFLLDEDEVLSYVLMETI